MGNDNYTGYKGPVIVKWRNISYLNGAKETTCRNILADLRKQHNCRHVTVDHVCEYYMISHEQYYRCQPDFQEL